MVEASSDGATQIYQRRRDVGMRDGRKHQVTHGEAQEEPPHQSREKTARDGQGVWEGRRVEKPDYADTTRT